MGPRCAAATGRRGDVLMAARAAVVALVVARCCMPLARAAPVVDAEIEALENLAQEWNEVHGRDTWMKGKDCDNMDSVECDGDGHVIALSIYSCTLVGTLPSALLALPYLKQLDLTFCNQIPRSLLDSREELSSPIDIDDPALYTSDLKASALQGLANLHQLTYLSLMGNIPVVSLPEQLSQLQKLQSLRLDAQRRLSGELPAWIFSLTDLTSLDIKGNNFSCSIPEAISSLKQLRKLRITEPTLSGSIPESIGALTNLQDLDLEGCGSLDGTIPASIGNLTALTSLSLRECFLSGSIPEAISSLGQLQNLDLQNSMLNGTIPAGIGHLTALYTLNLKYNFLSGSIPEAISNLKQLGELELKDNSLSGTIPACITHLTALITLSLDNNRLAGSIPAAITTLTNLVYLDLRSNNLSGTIPASIAHLQGLGFLGLGDNRLTGAIPAAITTLTNLQYLNLEGNQLTGALPSFDHTDPLDSFIGDPFNDSNNNNNNDLTASESLLPLNTTSLDGTLQQDSLCTNPPCESPGPAVMGVALSVLQAPQNLLLLLMLPLAVLLLLAFTLPQFMRRLKNRPHTRYFFSKRALAARQAAMGVEINC